MSVQIVELGPGHCDALLRFFTDLPDGDRTFIKEDVTDPDVVRSWTGSDTGGRRWVAVEDGDESPVLGYLAVRRLSGWSDHVGEVRLVISPGCRGTGLGRRLARHALTQAFDDGLSKLVVEVVAEQGGDGQGGNGQSAAVALFSGLGFSGEALLEDHIRDRDGELRDLMVLAHHVGRTWSSMSTLGLADVLGPEAD